MEREQDGRWRREHGETHTPSSSRSTRRKRHGRQQATVTWGRKSTRRISWPLHRLLQCRPTTTRFQFGRAVLLRHRGGPTSDGSHASIPCLSIPDPLSRKFIIISLLGSEVLFRTFARRCWLESHQISPHRVNLFLGRDAPGQAHQSLALIYSAGFRMFDETIIFFSRNYNK